MMLSFPVTLINAQRVARGQSLVGFINPTLYAAAEANPSLFNDITVGANNMCDIDYGMATCASGFTATTGWDAASGLGTITYSKKKTLNIFSSRQY